MNLTREWNDLWSEAETSNQLNPAQLYRHELIMDELERPTKVLEVGCGSGELLGVIRGKFPNVAVVGTDVSSTALRLAAPKCEGAEFFPVDLTETTRTGPESWASHLVCSEVLEHVDDPDRALEHCRYWLAAGGKIILTVPAGPISAYDTYLGHRRHFTAGALHDLLHVAGFENIRVKRAGFPFFNLYRLAVIARGKKLIEDAKSLPVGSGGLFALLRGLFRLNLPFSPWGWQLIATAHRPV